MARIKTYNIFSKIVAALRKVFRYSPMRKQALAAVVISNGYFKCPLCKTAWPLQMADVDHEPPLGPQPKSFPELADWAYRLFYGPVQVICKICHKAKTARQRRKKAA